MGWSLRIRRKKFTRGFERAAAIGLILIAAASCGDNQRRQEPVSVRMLFPGPAPSDEMAALIAEINAGSQAWRLVPVATDGSGHVVAGVQRGDGALGLAQSDLVYTAFRRGTNEDSHPFQNLRGIAVGKLNRLFALVRNEASIRSVADLRGKRVAVSPLGTGGEPLARMLLGGYGLTYADLDVRHHQNHEMEHYFQAERLDAMLIVGSYATEDAIAPTIGRQLRPLPIDAQLVSRLRGDYPFIRPVQIEWHNDAGVQRVESIGTDALLIARRDLPERLVYEVTRAMMENDLVETAISPDAEMAPATPIPLHPGAARYYRELQLRR